ncbi:hypothetical protein [Enterobacter roggenkampii]|uniref:hypothetical protein n=2 Tax=Enterobacter cloacae complex TaxID=354276 RepID=UPI001304DB6F|nr:hypothetical protein [Enterobacter roggenkampii]
MRMADYYYEQMLADYKILEEEYEYLVWKGDGSLSEAINKHRSAKNNNEQHNRK